MVVEIGNSSTVTVRCDAAAGHAPRLLRTERIAVGRDERGIACAPLLTDERSVTTGPLREVDLALRQHRRPRRRLSPRLWARIAGGRPRHPVGDAEGVVFGEVAVVEDQDEMAFAGPDALDAMAPAARKVPDVARDRSRQSPSRPRDAGWWCGSCRRRRSPIPRHWRASAARACRPDPAASRPRRCRCSREIREPRRRG